MLEYDKMFDDGRPVGAAGAGEATAPTDFGKSFNAISARKHFMLQKIPQIPHKFFGGSPQISQNIWDIIEKSPYRASVIDA